MSYTLSTCLSGRTFFIEGAGTPEEFAECQQAGAAWLKGLPKEKVVKEPELDVQAYVRALEAANAALVEVPVASAEPFNPVAAAISQ